MKKSLEIAFGLIICLSLAVFAYLWATNMMDSLYNYRSPLSKSPPTPGESTGLSMTSKVVIILIDALRVDTAFDPKVMPFLNSLKKNSAWGIIHSQTPSYSEPGWTTILTGAWPEISDGPAMNLEYENIYPFTQDNIFSAAHRYNFKTAISGYFWFERLVPPGSVDYGFYTEGEDDQADQDVLAAAIPWIADNEISLVLIHFDQVDYAGHYQGGPRNSSWNEAAIRTDSMVENIVEEIDLNLTTILILSDHGQIDSGGHGGHEEIVLTEPFIFAGKGIIPGQYPDIQMVDIAPTISVLLGLNIPAANQGRPLLDILDANEEKRSLINIALTNQQNDLLAAYEDAINQNIAVLDAGSVVTSTQNSILLARKMRQQSEMLRRIPIVIVLIGIIIFFAFRKLKIKIILKLLIAGIIYVTLFNILYLVIFKHPYSLSWINSQIELLTYSLTTTLISFIFGWLFFIHVTRTSFKMPQEISRKTIYFSISTIILTALPVIISFVINGPLITWTLPDMLSMYLAFLALIQIVFISIIGLGISIFSLSIYLVVRKFAGVKFDEN